LFASGFMPKYNVWTEHGERGIMLENDEEEEESIPNFVDDYGAFFEDTAIGDVGVLPPSSPRDTPRRLIVGKDSTRS